MTRFDGVVQVVVLRRVAVRLVRLMGPIVLAAELKVDVLAAVDGDDGALFGELRDGARVGYGDVDAGLQHGRGEHEDEEEHEDDVDQRRDVDLRQGALGVGASSAVAD